MTDDEDHDAAFRTIVLETKAKVDRLYELMRPHFEPSPLPAAPSPQPSPLSDVAREELEDRLVRKNREMQLLKIRNDYLEHKLEQYEPKDDDEVGQEYE
jgi:hypothetical protein